MTRAIADVIANLILPPAGPLLIAIAGLVLIRRHRRLGVAASASGIALLWVLSLPIVGSSLLRPLEPPPVARNDLARAEAIVVLGGGVIDYSAEYAGPVLGYQSWARVRYGAHLARESGLPILLTAGTPYGKVPEAEVMASVL
ncbi:MAG: YdcF family protein, partial [Burkholderiales bacterium]